MKKLILSIFVLIVGASLFFGFKKNEAEKNLLAPINMTLNGVDESTATQMIDNFSIKYDKDKGLKSVSAFYRVGQIDSIRKLLELEHADPKVKTDGLRIYLGSDRPAGTKLNVKILLVSTKEKTATPLHLSTHGDYYPHPSGMLSTHEIGIAVRDHGQNVLRAGGRLYSRWSIKILSACKNPSLHYLRGDSAHKWVRARYEKGGKDDSPYSTISDWFSYEFIDAFFKAITDPVNKYSGLRIYLARGPRDEQNKIRDVFILVPTKKSITGRNVDNFNCLEDLPGVHFPSDSLTSEGGYDKGELCPYKCN